MYNLRLNKFYKDTYNICIQYIWSMIKIFKEIYKKKRIFIKQTKKY